MAPPQALGHPAPPHTHPQAGIHPEQPAHTLGRAAFDSVWAHSVALLQRGFSTGSILTVRQLAGVFNVWDRLPGAGARLGP